MGRSSALRPTRTIFDVIGAGQEEEPLNRATPVYRWSGAAMLRASTYPSGLEVPAGPDLAAEDATAQARRWLAEVWGIPEVREAALLASPVLGPEIERAVRGAGSPRRVRRLMLSLAAYLARWQRRATPFGLFAGIAGVAVGSTAAALWGQQHERLLRADGAWLAGVIARLENEPLLLERLPLLANNTAQVRGDRIVMPGVPAGGDALLMPPVEVSVRATDPVMLALERAAEPVPYTGVRAALAERHPQVLQERLDALLAGLVEQQLRRGRKSTTLTCPDPPAPSAGSCRAPGPPRCSGGAVTSAGPGRRRREGVGPCPCATGPGCVPAPGGSPGCCGRTGTSRRTRRPARTSRRPGGRRPVSGAAARNCARWSPEPSAEAAASAVGWRSAAGTR